METVVKKNKKESESSQNENNYTEQYKSLFVLRKGRINENEVWYATVGKMLVSDGAFGTKEELIKNLENITLDRVCKILIGVTDRIIKLNEEK